MPIKFAILGAGGVGGYFGGLLARAGHEVYVFARGANLAAIKERGLEVRTPEESFVIPVQARHDVKDFGQIDCAILAVKNYSLAEISPAAKSLAENGALVLPLLNGVEVVDRLIEYGVPAKQVLGGLTAISAVKVAPGVFERKSDFQRITLGQINGEPNADLNERMNNYAAAFREVGIESEVSADITADLWRKFAFIASAAAACGLARCSVGELRRRPYGSLLFERAVREVVSVAKARNVALRDDEVERMARFFEKLADGMKPSFLLDLESGGPTEIEDLSGAVSRLGRLAGVDTPVHDTATASLTIMGRPGNAGVPPALPGLTRISRPDNDR